MYIWDLPRLKVESALKEPIFVHLEQHLHREKVHLPALHAPLQLPQPGRDVPREHLRLQLHIAKDQRARPHRTLARLGQVRHVLGQVRLVVAPEGAHKLAKAQRADLHRVPVELVVPQRAVEQLDEGLDVSGNEDWFGVVLIGVVTS